MNLSHRVVARELMDDPALAVDRHAGALRGLRRVNLLSGTGKVILHAMKTHIAANRRNELRILDVACGGGDVTIQVAKLLRADGWHANLIGWDRSGTAIEIARQSALRSEVTNVSFEVHDVLVDDFGRDFDVILCTLFLHHLPLEKGGQLLAKMVRSAGSLVLVDDLRRTWFGLFLAHVACRALTRSPIVHVDGPLSVRAAYREGEIQSLVEAAGIPIPKIRRHWPQRFLLQWRR